MTAAGAPLVPSRERSDPEPFETAAQSQDRGVEKCGSLRCSRPSPTLAWETADGELLPVRCGAPNRCAYCSWLAALENAAVVRLDAAERLPEIGFTLTTRAAQTGAPVFRRDVEQVFKAVRRRWPAAQYLGQVEFTTGQGTHAGGARRIHQHGLLKGVPRRDVDRVERVLRDVWRERTGAHRVEAHELHRPAGAIAYLVNHHQKSAQAPPRGWTGKRLRPSKGYYERPVTELRGEARAQLADRRARHAVAAALAEAHAWEATAEGWRAGPDAGALIDQVLAAALAKPPPRLVRVGRMPTDWTEHGDPAGWATQVLEVVHAA